ncbi:MAG: ABC transporter ATP-binding protein [Anaerolineae bacterium]|jgi:NitT/TauT family transport system ATP-binding protein
MERVGGTPLLVVEELAAGHRGPAGWLPVLDGISFQVTEAEFVCLVGPSGCGKTTLLRLVMGLEQPTAGRICLEGEVVDRPRRDTGVVFQEPTLMAWRTVEANVALPLEVARVPATDIRRKTRALLDLVGLAGFEDAYPAQLSGGMAQRVALARALIHDPRLLLLDEPFGALDALTRERMGRELLRIWRARRKTAVMVTHSVPEAVFLADRVLVLGPRPASIVAEVEVNRPRPRTSALLGDPAFAALTRRVREALDRAGALNLAQEQHHAPNPYTAS